MEPIPQGKPAEKQPVFFGKFSGNLEEVVCPICQAPPPPVVLYNKKEGGIKFLSCPGCSLHYASPRFDEPSLLQIYENESFTDFSRYQTWSYQQWAQSRNRSFIVSQLKSRLVLSYTGAGGKVLDVGCATGEFCLEASKQGLACEGIDISKKMSDIARQTLGVPANCLDIADFNPPYLFDALVLWDVLEHVYDPTLILKHCHRLLKKGGHLFAQVPNVDGISNRFKDLRCRLGLSHKDYAHFGFPYHLYFFGKESLGKLLAKADLQAVHFESWSHNYKNGKDAFPLKQINRLVNKACISDYIIVVGQK